MRTNQRKLRALTRRTRKTRSALRSKLLSKLLWKRKNLKNTARRRETRKLLKRSKKLSQLLKSLKKTKRIRSRRPKLPKNNPKLAKSKSNLKLPSMSRKINITNPLNMPRKKLLPRQFRSLLRTRSKRKSILKLSLLPSLSTLRRRRSSLRSLSSRRNKIKNKRNPRSEPHSSLTVFLN